MNFFQVYTHPLQKERLLFLGYWIGSLIIWSFAMNVSLVIVIVFSIIGNFVVVRPLAKLFFLLKNFVNKRFFNNFDIFEAYYAGFELGRITRIFLKLSFFMITMIVSKMFMEAYLTIINKIQRNRQ